MSRIDHDFLSSVHDDHEIGSFHIWAAHTGAHRSGGMYRPHEAAHVHSRVCELIEENQEDFNNSALSRMLIPRR